MYIYICISSQALLYHLGICMCKYKYIHISTIHIYIYHIMLGTLGIYIKYKYISYIYFIDSQSVVSEVAISLLQNECSS